VRSLPFSFFLLLIFVHDLFFSPSIPTHWGMTVYEPFFFALYLRRREKSIAEISFSRLQQRRFWSLQRKFGLFISNLDSSVPAFCYVKVLFLIRAVLPAGVLWTLV